MPASSVLLSGAEQGERPSSHLWQVEDLALVVIRLGELSLSVTGCNTCLGSTAEMTLVVCAVIEPSLRVRAQESCPGTHLL